MLKFNTESGVIIFFGVENIYSYNTALFIVLYIKYIILWCKYTIKSNRKKYVVKITRHEKKKN